MYIAKSVNLRWEVHSLNRGRMGGDPRRENNPNNNRKVTMDKKTMRTILLRLSRYILRYKWLFLLALCMMFTSNIIALAGPKISGNAIDALTELTGNEMVAKVGGYCVLLAILYTVSSLLSYALSATMIYLSQKIVYTMRKQVFDHLTTLPVNYFDTHATGDIISRISYDIDTVNTSLSHDLLQIGASMVTIIGSLIMMVSISPLLILVFAITVPLSIFFTRRKTKKSVRFSAFDRASWVSSTVMPRKCSRVKRPLKLTTVSVRSAIALITSMRVPLRLIIKPSITAR